MKLDKKVAIVTGAGSGIGKAIAKDFAREGAKVVVAGHHVDSCQETVAEIGDAGGEATALQVDVSAADEVAELVRNTVTQYGQLDILVNNAGVVLQDPLEDMTEEEWDRVVDVDLKGTFLGMKYALPEMEKIGEGKVINITSIAGIVGFPQIAGYAAAKGGVIALTKEAASEYAPKSINVNAIAPGVIKTKMTDPILKDSTSAKQMKSAIPYPRFGEPDDIAHLATYLASADSDFVNGETIVIDGGQTAQ